MGAFPEDYRIKGSRLIRMWLAEGFVKSNCNRSLEKKAEDFLHDLVERNLFLVREYKYGKPKSYSMHDMLRDLCIMISEEDKFLHVQKGRKVTFSNPCRVSVQASNGMEDFNASAESMSPARSFIGIGCRGLPSGAFFTLRLLRVLDVMDMWFAAFPREIFEFANLRFLAFSCNARIPSGISRLCYLQTLITRSLGIDVPSELWRLSELRNLNVNGFELLNDVELKHSVLVKAQMISSVFVPDSVYRRGFFKTIPNIKKLGIVTDEKTSTEIDISHLQELEVLRCTSRTFPDCSDCLPRVSFPCNIKKLILVNYEINPGVLKALCALHKLEVLKICECKFVSKAGTSDEEWVAEDEDVFCSLQFLTLQELTLERWKADRTNFPTLCHLCVNYCGRLEEIPSSFEEISTLQLIELYKCTTSVVASAQQIQKVQHEDSGSNDLKLRII